MYETNVTAHSSPGVSWLSLYMTELTTMFQALLDLASLGPLSKMLFFIGHSNIFHYCFRALSSFLLNHCIKKSWKTSCDLQFWLWPLQMDWRCFYGGGLRFRRNVNLNVSLNVSLEGNTNSVCMKVMWRLSVLLMIHRHYDGHFFIGKLSAKSRPWNCPEICFCIIWVNRPV